ncbi:MAG: M56 family metallopeptidase [Oscillospiraceae bacterium]|nr:M56 family metallopeptidase [Oscillospiraceae bacterium]
MRLDMLRAVGEASLSAAVMILAVLALRMRFQDRTPRRAFCLLWDMALVRLLVLGALPSPVSIRRWLPAAGWLPEMGAQAQSTAVSQPEVVTAVMGPGMVIQEAWQTAYVTEDTLQFVTAGAAQAPAPLDWGAVLTAVWLGVAVLLAAGFLWSHLRSGQVYAASLPVRDRFVADWLAEHPLRRPVQARVSDRVAAPLTYGVLYPVILLPREMDWEDREALACVLSHEHTHIRRFDALRKVFLAAALCLHWFNPLVWAMYALCSRDIELACDEAVLRGGADRERYALALLSMEERRGRWSPSGSHFSGHALEERIKAIMKRKHVSITALVAVLVVMCVTTTVFASAAPETKREAQTAVWTYDQAVEDTAILFKGGEDGAELYSDDGGRTWVNQEQYHAKYGSWADGWHVEWWTYEDYKAWLEEEKAELQGVIGDQGYTGSRGWFTWDQKMVDETIAMYEGILEDIGNGALYSKRIVDKYGNEVEDAMVGSGGPIVSTRFENSAVSTNDGDAGYTAWLEELASLGVTGTREELYYGGQLVHTIVDGRKVERGYTYGYHYKNDSGTIDLQVQRALTLGPDGYWDTSGRMTGLVSERDAGFDQVMTDLLGYDDMVWRGYGSRAPENADAIEASFAQYEKYGLVYLPRECGIGSMTYSGQPVSAFVDRNPGGGEFSFEDPYVEGGLRVQTVYDRNGNLTGLRVE